MTRGAFNTDCDVFLGPGSAHPGLYIGTFNCRLVREDAIATVGVGTAIITHYLTILDYQPLGAWTHPFIGFDPSLADQIAVPAGTAIRFWVTSVVEIAWGSQTPYWRAYLSPVPIPDTGVEGGLLFGGYAQVETDIVYLPSGGLLLGGYALVETDIVYLPSGGLLLGGYAVVETDVVILPSGGLLLGGVALVENDIVIKGTGGILLGGVALVENDIVILPIGGIRLGGAATIVLTPAVYWKDTFTGTNGTALTAHTPDVGTGGYTNINGSMQIQSGTAKALTLPSNYCFVSYDPGRTAFTATVDISIPNDSTDRYVLTMFRVVDANNFWDVTIHIGVGATSVGSFTVSKVVAGVTTLVGTGTVTINVGATTITHVITPTTIAVTINGVTVSATDSALGSATKQAMFLVNTTGSSFDNLLVM